MVRELQAYPPWGLGCGAALLMLALLAGCAGTRDLPYSATSPAPVLRAGLQGMQVDVELLRIDQTTISGGHHEGMAQLRQPWIWDISASQREALYSNVKEVARLAFLDELKRQGLKVRVLNQPLASSAAAGRLHIRGEIKDIELNTYGRGLSGRFEGFGSAGNYWEARVHLAGVQVVESRGGALVWQGDLQQYAKLPDSPVKLEMTHFDLLANSLKMGMAGTHPLKMADAAYKSKADYAVDKPHHNPVELAARSCARDLVQRIAEQMASSAKAR